MLFAADLSLTATGYARYSKCDWVNKIGNLDFGTIKPPKGMSGIPRLDYVCREVVEMARGASFVVLEDVAFSKNKAYAKEIAGLAYLVRYALWKREQPYVLVQATSLKKWATGRGNAEKNLVLREVWRRFNVEAANDNEADAVAAIMLARALVGDWTPTTEAQREVLVGLRKANPEVLDGVEAQANG